jgi:Fe-S-cluster containining protein
MPPPNHDKSLSASVEAAEFRRSQFIQAIPPVLAAKEDAIQRRLDTENASSRSKLRKIYSLLTELGEAAKPFVACSKGCSACCKMNVMISQVEASFIEMETGIKPVKIVSNKIHPINKFVGIPCSFLSNDSCSIYDARPFACRKHFSFDASPYWCDPTRLLEKELPMIGFSGAEGALMDVAGVATGGIFADIRDFFPLRRL